MKVLSEETRQAVKELERINRETRKNIVLGCQHLVLQRDKIVNSVMYTCEDCKGTITTESGLSLDQAIERMEKAYERF